MENIPPKKYKNIKLTINDWLIILIPELKEGFVYEVRQKEINLTKVKDFKIKKIYFGLIKKFQLDNINEEIAIKFCKINAPNKEINIFTMNINQTYILSKTKI